MTKRLPLIALVFISAAAALPLFLNSGFLNTRGGGDSPFLLFRLQQLYGALSQGVFPVRWMPDAAYGLGYPFFSYYAALPLYVAALFKFLGLSYVLALKLTQFTGGLLAAVGMYGWIRSLGRSRLAALTAAALYSFAPFHLVNLFVRGDSLNEYWAFAFYPLCLWAVQRISSFQSSGEALNNNFPNRLLRLGTSVIPLTIAYAALIFTHNISALIFSPFLGLYIIIVAPQASTINTRFLFVVHCSLSIALALALTAFFWLPALRESDFGQLAPVTEGYFHYSNHFRGLNLVQLTPFFNFDVGASSTTPFAMGLAQAAITLIALVVAIIQLFFNRRPHPQPSEAPTSSRPNTFVILNLSFVILGLLISTFMLTRLSESLWANLPLLPFVQFPWRFLSIQSLFASALIAFAIGGQQTQVVETETTDTPAPATRSVFDLPLVVLNLTACVLSLGALRPDFVPITDGDVTPDRLQLYEYFTGNIGTTINYEYLPRWVQPRPYASEEFIYGTPSLKVTFGEADGERLDKGAASQSWLVTVQSDVASVAVPLLYWPGWEATVNGQPLPIHPAENGLGWIAFELPQGEHKLDFSLGNTSLRQAASLVSLVALLLLLILSQPWRGLRALARLSRPAWLRLVVLAVATIALVAVGHIVNRRTTLAGPATMDFDQQGYMNSAPVPFGNGSVLRGYNYSANTLAPDDPLGVALVWQAASDEAHYQLDLVSPAEHLLKTPATFASTTGTLSNNQSAALIHIPNNLPTGVYFLRLTLYQGSNFLAPALTLNNQPRGSLYLRPVRVLGSNVDSGVTQQPNPIALASLVADQPQPNILTLALGWRAASSLPANYLLAVRLRDADGNELAALDAPPTGGIYPTGAWRVGELVTDHFTFNLPPGLPPGDYPLTLTFYKATDLAPVQTMTLPIRLSQWTPPPTAEPSHRFSETLALQDISLPASTLTGARFNFTVSWASLAPLSENYTARWSAVSATGKEVAVEDHPLAIIPTSQWNANVLVLGRPSLKLPISAPAGDYSLNLQLLNGSGEPLSQTVVVGTFTVAASGRTTELPPMQFEADAAFGPITLAGYDAAIGTDSLSLTLVVRAQDVMDTDYKYFIHIVDPNDESIPAQSDGFPTIPTSDWEKDEVVTITASLPLTDLSPGVVYNIAVGFYDPATNERLADRVILSQGVTKP